MQLKGALFCLVLTAVVLAQTPPPPAANAILDSGLPNLYYPTMPPILSGVTSTDPLLNYAPAAGDPDAKSTPCPTPPPSGTPPCVLTVQYNNARQDANLYENVLTVAGVLAASPSKSVFLVDSLHLPAPITGNPAFPTNPIYAQPLYEAGLSISGTTYNVLYIATLNGEVYAYNADNAALTSQSSCAPGSSSGCLWFRDENNVAGMQGLKHNCNVGTTSGQSVVSGLPNYLNFAGTISTPVIQPKGTAAAIYVTNLCQRPDTSEHWYLTALNLTTGATIGTTEIAYSTLVPVPNGPQQDFVAASQLQRAGLLSVSSSNTSVCSSPPCRSVIASFGTAVNETDAQYQGWTFVYDANSPSTLPAQANPYSTQCAYPAQTNNKPVPCNQLSASSEQPNQCGQGGGLWMFARGPAANTNGEVFTVAGNGGFNYCQGAGCTIQCMPSGHPMSNFTDLAESVLNIQMSAVWNYTGTGPAPFWPSDYFVPSSIPSWVSGASYTDPGNCENSSSASAPCTYFQTMNDYDWDLGTSGPLLFEDLYLPPGTETASPAAMVFTANKRGDGYVLLQSSLGQYHSTSGDQAAAEFNLTQTSNILCTDSLQPQGKGQCDQPITLAYWKPAPGGFLVAWPWHETLSSYQWTNPGGGYNFNLAATTSSPLPGAALGGYGGGTLAITANTSDSSGDAIVWASVFPQSCTTIPGDPYSGAGRGCPGYLLAYKLDSAAGALTWIWPSSITLPPAFEPAPFAIPTAVNGYVYAPAYGLYDSANSKYDISGVQAYVF